MKNKQKYGPDGILFLTFTTFFAGIITFLVISSSFTPPATWKAGVLSSTISTSPPGSNRTDFLMLPSFGHYGSAIGSIQIFKTRSSHPLSKQNFRKTRPRGIPAQEPTVKPLAVTRIIQVFPPSTFVLIPSTVEHYPINCDKVAARIRPPPDCLIS